MSRPPAGPGGPGELTDEQVARLAGLIAGGRCGLPDGLTPGSLGRLTAAARGQLRARLVRFVARAVAAQIHAAGPGSTEVPEDARPQV